MFKRNWQKLKVKKFRGMLVRRNLANYGRGVDSSPPPPVAGRVKIIQYNDGFQGISMDFKGF